MVQTVLREKKTPTIPSVEYWLSRSGSLGRETAARILNYLFLPLSITKLEKDDLGDSGGTGGSLSDTNECST